MRDYRTETKENIRQWMEDNKDYIDYNDFEDTNDLEQYLNDNLWTADDVTGNASGSYYCNSYKAKDMVLEDMDTVREALEEFGVDAATIGEKFLDEDWEWLDVTARCFVLGECISEYIEDNREEIEKAIEEAHEFNN